VSTLDGKHQAWSAAFPVRHMLFEDLFKLQPVTTVHIICLKASSSRRQNSHHQTQSFHPVSIICLEAFSPLASSTTKLPSSHHTSHYLPQSFTLSPHFTSLPQSFIRFASSASKLSSSHYTSHHLPQSFIWSS
jgi:hypothetical protein